ncbi:MAG TPA: CoA transferase [Acidimicrobiales bacterium]|nr:CoA transferase [Acidimicrobiales bacterium]
MTDVRIIDCSSLIAGPGCARYLADYGADVIKVEKPGDGDAARRLGWREPDGETSLWWKILSRNKRCVTLDLRSDEGRDAMLGLCDGAGVLVENFRPGTLERLGLGPDVLLARNPRLVITRVSGFGQDGPYASRPGFATLAEAMSGFAAINGEPDGPPLLPPVALTDEITALVGAFATMVALHSGVGQVVDVNLLDSMVQMLGALPSASAALGYEQPRLGSGIPYTVPRGTYRTADDQWVALSTSSELVAERLLDLIGLADDDRLRTGAGRVAHRDEVDGAVSAWFAARSSDEAVKICMAADVAVAPVLSVGQMLADRHVVARGMLCEVDGVPMPGMVARLSATPGHIAWAGRVLGADQDDVFGRPEGPGGHRGRRMEILADDVPG